MTDFLGDSGGFLSNKKPASGIEPLDLGLDKQAPLDLGIHVGETLDKPEPASLMDKVEGGARAFDKGILNTPVGLMDFAATLGSSLAGTDLTQDKLYQAARGYEKAVDDRLPSNNALSPTTEAIMQGLGQVGGQTGMAALSGGTSAAAQMMKPVAGMTIAGMGTTQGIQDANNHKASPEDVKTAAVLGSAIGLTEFAPVEKILGIADKAAPGIKGKIVDVLATGGLEGLQEWVQQGGTNLVAKLTYDDERKLSDGLEQSAQVGGATGIVAATIATLLGVKHMPKMPTSEAESDAITPEVIPPAALPAPTRRTVENAVDAQIIQGQLSDSSAIDPEVMPNLPSTQVRQGSVYDGSILTKIRDSYPEGSPRQQYALAYAEKKLRGNPNTAKTPDVIPLEEPSIPVNVSTEDAELQTLKEMLADPKTTAEDRDFLQKRLDEIQGTQTIERRLNTKQRALVEDLVNKKDIEGLSKLIYHDDLTGLMNKRSWDEAERLANMVGAEVGSLDLAGMKYVNDTFGHAAGDQLFKMLGSELKDSGTLLFRKGGDEFAAVFEKGQDANAILSNLRKNIGQMEVVLTDEQGNERTFSGWSLDYGSGQNFDEADAQLYTRRADAEKAGTRNTNRGEQPYGLVEGATQGNENVSAEETKPVDQVSITTPEEPVAFSGQLDEPVAFENTVEGMQAKVLEGIPELNEETNANIQKLQKLVTPSIAPQTVQASKPFTKMGSVWISPVGDGRSIGIIKEGTSYVGYVGTPEEIQQDVADEIGSWPSLPKARKALGDGQQVEPTPKITKVELKNRLDALKQANKKAHDQRVAEFVDEYADPEDAEEFVSWEEMKDEEFAVDFYGDQYETRDGADIAKDIWTIMNDTRGAINPKSDPEIQVAKERLGGDVKKLQRWAKKVVYDKFLYPATIVDSNGEPIRLYHGTAETYVNPTDDSLGTNTAAASAKLGHFLAANPETANSYTDKNNHVAFQKALSRMRRNPTWQKYNRVAGRVNRLVVDLASDIADEEQRVTTEVGWMILSMTGGQKVATSAIDEQGQLRLRQSIEDYLAQHPERRQDFNEIQDLQTNNKELYTKAEQIIKAIQTEENYAVGIVPQIRVAHATMVNPYIYDMKGKTYREKTYYDIIKQAWADGYDGVIIKNTYDGGPKDDIYVVKSAKQIIPAFEHEAAVINSLWKRLGKYLKNERGSVDMSGAYGLAAELGKKIKALYQALKQAAVNIKHWGTARKKSQSVHDLSQEEQADTMVGKRFYMKTVSNAIKANMDEAVKPLYQRMVETNRIVPEYKKGSKILPVRQQAWIPQNMRPQLRRGAEDLKISGIAKQMRSPSNIFRNYFETWANPSIDMSEAGMSFFTNLSNNQKWAKDIMSNVPDTSKEMQAALDKIYEGTRPLIDARDKQILKLGRLSEKIKLEKDPAKKKALVDSYKAAQKRVRIKTAKIQKELTTKFDSALPALAEAYSDVRITLQVLGELPEGIKISSDEIEAAAKIKEFFEQSGRALQKVGIPIILSRGYMHRILPKVLNDPESQGFARDSKLPLNMKFLHQEEDGRLWYPSMHMILKSYIPMAERKIAYQPFLNRWTEAIDDMPSDLRQYMTDWLNSNIFRQPLSTVNKMLNNVVGFEYIRLIGMSLSVGFKHFTKAADSLARYDVVTNTKAAAQVTKLMADKLAKGLGINIPENTDIALLKAFVNSAIMTKMMDETPNMTTVGRNIRQVAGLPVNIVETFDNGLTLFSTALSASSQNLSPEQASRIIWETMLAANFRGGHDQPLMYKDSKVRAAAMFQMTPHKLWEYRGSILVRAMNGETNLFGTPYKTILARYLMMYGLAEWLVRELFDSSIVDQALHTPYGTDWVEPVKGGYAFKEPKATTSPLIDWAVQMHNKGVVKGTAKHFSYWGQATKTIINAKGKYNKNWYNNPWLQQAGIKKVHKSNRAVSRRR